MSANFLVSFVESKGRMIEAGAPTLLVWTKALQLGDDVPEAVSIVLARDPNADAWREFRGNLDGEDLQKIVDCLARLGLPDRVPSVRIDGSPTADYWRQISLTVRSGMSRQPLVLDIFGMDDGRSSFDGPDANNVRTLLHTMMTVAGFHHFSQRLYGQSAASSVDPVT